MGQSGASCRSCWRIAHNFFFFLTLHSLLLTYLHADRGFWLNVRMAVLPKCCSHTLPSPGYFGMLEKVWLTPGRNPLATAIYREETVTFASGAYEGERERKREAWRIQLILEINNLSCNPSYFFPGQIKEERGVGSRQEERLCPDSLFLPISEKSYLEIRQADPNWIKLIWILLSLLFLPTVYTVLSSISCDSVMSSMH